MFLIDKFSSVPVYEQLIERVEQEILLGIYPPGSALPSLRELSVQLGINPNTIQKSYAELTRRGVICPSPGSGSYVSPDAPLRIRENALKKLPEFEETVRSLALLGVTEEEIGALVRRVYASGTDRKE